jgi:diguanylate cyclase (GGDEF)-like protein
MAWKDWTLGAPDFGEAGEYRHFKYVFLMIVMLAGLPVCAPFIVADRMGANAIGQHRQSLEAYVFLSVALIGMLRTRPDRLILVATIYSLATYMVHMSAFLFVPQDEMRVVWFYALVAGVYILLGQKSGAGIAALSIVSLVVANRYTSAPLSEKGLGTWVVSMVSLSIMFHTYTNRSLSFFKRLQASNQQLRHLSQHDALTGVLNLRAMHEVTNRLIELAQRQRSPYAVLFIDLDHFKRINDEHGHEAGDMVLKAVAQALRLRLRKSDVLGRIGGEEFLAFLPETDETGALQLAEQLRQDIEALMPQAGGGPLRVTASIGVTSQHDPTENLATLQKQADQAMYQAKAAGRNRVTSFAVACSG